LLQEEQATGAALQAEQSETQTPLEDAEALYGQKVEPTLQPAQVRGTHVVPQHAPPQFVELQTGGGPASPASGGGGDDGASTLASMGPTTSCGSALSSGASTTDETSGDASVSSGAAPFVSTLQALTQKPPRKPPKPTSTKVCLSIEPSSYLEPGRGASRAEPQPRAMISTVSLTASSVRDLSLHVVAWGLLRTCPPARAHAILLQIGGWLAPITTRDEARWVFKSLSGHGTCLSRSLAVAARTPTADVVIGVKPRQNAPLFAHAWLEIDGIPLDPSDVAGAVIARLPGRRSTRSSGSAAE
jgi:Transglutaminase-like superfamily